MAEVVVIGGGGHAKVLIAVLRKLDWDVLGYTDGDDRGAILRAVHLGRVPAVLAKRGAYQPLTGGRGGDVVPRDRRHRYLAIPPVSLERENEVACA